MSDEWEEGSKWIGRMGKIGAGGGGHFAIMRMDSHVGTMEGFVHGNR